VQPSVTFFTTFTYWTTSIEGDETIVTSREETRTDILPASATAQLITSPTAVTGEAESGVRFTARPDFNGGGNEEEDSPDLESGIISPSSVQAVNAAGTPSLSSTDSFEDLDDEFTLVSSSQVSSSSVQSSSRTRPRTFTPVIRPNLFRTRNQNVRPRARSRTATTVAIITRSDVTPTLIATPAAAQPTPSFGSSSRVLASASLLTRNRSRFSSSRGANVRASASSVNPSEIVPSSTLPPEDPAKPTIISNLRLRRPNPFRARLKERQRQRLQQLRQRNNEGDKENEAEEQEETQEASPTTQRATVPVPRFPSGLPGRTPIFVSSRTENFSRRPRVNLRGPNDNDDKPSEPAPTSSSTTSSGSPFARNAERLRLQRERARARINSLFKRRRPSFLRPQPSEDALSGSASGGADEQPSIAIDLTAQESRRRRRKRQVSTNYYSEFGARTRKRQTFRRGATSTSSGQHGHSRRRQPQYYDTLDDPPFTAFAGSSPSSYQDSNAATSASSSASSTSPNQNPYESYYADYNANQYSSSSAGRATSSSSSTKASRGSGGRAGNTSIRPSNNVRRQVDSPDSFQSTRSRSRFQGRRTRLRTRPTTTAVSTPQREPEPTTPTRTALRSRFRPSRPRSFSSGNRGSNRFQQTDSNRGSSSSSGGRFGSSTRDRFSGSRRIPTKPPKTSLFDYDDYFDYDADIEIKSSHNTVPDSITVTHQVPFMTVIPVRENGRDELRDILTASPSLEVIAATALKSTDVDGKPVIFANAETNAIAPGTQEITFEALRATETTTVTFTPTRIRGIRTRFSHIVPSTIYNIQPVVTQVVEPVDQQQLLNQLLLGILGGQNPNSLKANPLPGQPNLPALNPSPTQFITHTNTYTTTITNVESKILPITLRGREIKTTLVESLTEVVTATEFSTETIINSALAIAPTLNPFGLAQQPQPQPQPTALPDLQQQLLAAQLQQQLQAQLRAQQQQLLNQQLLSQVNLGPTQPIVQQQALPQATQAPQPEPEPPAPSTSVVTKFVSGKNPGEFSIVTSTVIIEGDDDEGRRRRRRDAEDLLPSPVEAVEMTEAPWASVAFSASIDSSFRHSSPQEEASDALIAVDFELESGMVDAASTLGGSRHISATEALSNSRA